MGRPKISKNRKIMTCILQADVPDSKGFVFSEEALKKVAQTCPSKFRYDKATKSLFGFLEYKNGKII